MTPEPLRVLIAGCGDLGSRVADKLLLETGNRVWGLRRSPKQRCEHASGFEWLVADMTKPETLTLLPAGITHVLFCAAPNSRTESAYRDVYFNGLKNVVERALNPALKRILFVSSSAVYGAHGDEWVDEETPANPQNFNGRILLESEQWLSRFCHEHAIENLSLRLSGIWSRASAIVGKTQTWLGGCALLTHSLGKSHSRGRRSKRHLASDEIARPYVYLPCDG